MADDPNFYGHSQSSDRTRPMSVTGFAFNPATATVDFSAVPGFDLARLQYLRHTRTGKTLYGRPNPPPYGLAEIDGVPVPLPPMAGKVLKLSVDCSGMVADEEVLAAYDPPTGG